MKHLKLQRNLLSKFLKCFSYFEESKDGKTAFREAPMRQTFSNPVVGALSWALPPRPVRQSSSHLWPLSPTLSRTFFNHTFGTPPLCSVLLIEALRITSYITSNMQEPLALFPPSNFWIWEATFVSTWHLRRGHVCFVPGICGRLQCHHLQHPTVTYANAVYNDFP